VQQSSLTAVFMPLALAILMLGLGLSLTRDDFKRILVYPRAVFVGLACQMLLLPAVAYLLAKGLDLPPEIAVGLMLLAASPGGPTANLFSHLAHGDVALNITLTATNSVLSLVSLPLIINFALHAFAGSGKTIPLQAGKVVQVVGLVLIPVILGMLVRHAKPALALRLDKPVRLISGVFLFLIIAATVAHERENLGKMFLIAGPAALAFNLASMAVGYLVPRLARVPERQAVAIGMEVGIHNGTLAIAIASSPLLLNNPQMAVTPAIYSLIMFFTATAFGYWAARQRLVAVPAT
jgi:BASS family bile acid:Na+ symporter